VSGRAAMIKIINGVLATIWRIKTDQSFEAVYLFSLLGLALTLAFHQMRLG
jgi:hypothetical protein